jgi:hypothetical protein
MGPEKLYPPADYGVRSDGSKKGPGFLGPRRAKDGSIMTEFSVGVEFDGKKAEIPTLVPTLTPLEIQHLLDGNGPTDAIVDKAVRHARERMKKGLSPFADERGR